VLFLANLVLLAWMQGWLGAWVAAPGQGEREPERMARQVNPELVQLLPPQAASAAQGAGSAGANSFDAAPNPHAPALAPDNAASAATFASAATVCLEAGPFTAAELVVAERAVRGAQIADLALRSVKIERSGAFMVYLGKYPSRAAMLTRLGDLRRAAIAADEVRGMPALEPGLQLGRFNDRAAADAAQARFVRDGLKNARVVVITPPVTATLLRVDKADGPQAARLGAIPLTPAGAAFSACAAGERG
jgi:hypothetical protein